MAAANDALPARCTENSDFAVICSFFEQFGDKSGILFPSFQDLQQMLENSEEVAYSLIELHVKLLRKLKKTVSFAKWEKGASKFASTYSEQDGWEIEESGYRNISLDAKLRLLKNLLEAQFDSNPKFKNEINKVSSHELRLQPIGRDLHGRRYWHLLDDDCNLRVYREDIDDETWELVSSDKESMLKLIEQLSSGKDFVDDEETSPETSGESNSNSQEGFIKTVGEEKTLEGPSEVKKFKSDKESSVELNEPIVSEAIESPILMVKGEGNGADCDTGNPGEDKPETVCQNETKEDSITGATEKSTGNTDMMSSSKATENAAGQLQNSSPVRDNWKETPPLIDKNKESEKQKSTVVNSNVSTASQIEPNNSLAEPEAHKSPPANKDSLQSDDQDVQACNIITMNQKSIEDTQGGNPVDAKRTDLPVDDQDKSPNTIKVAHNTSRANTSLIREQRSDKGRSDLNKPLVQAQTLSLVSYGDSDSSISNEDESDLEESKSSKDPPTMKSVNSGEVKIDEPVKEVNDKIHEIQGGTNVRKDIDNSVGENMKTEDPKVVTAGQSSKETKKNVTCKEEALDLEKETIRHVSKEKQEEAVIHEKNEEAARVQDNSENVPEKMLGVDEKSQISVKDAENTDKVGDVKENHQTSKEKIESADSFSFIPLSKDNRLMRTTLSFDKPLSEQKAMEDDIDKADNLLTNSKSENNKDESPCNDFEVKDSKVDNSLCSKDLKESNSSSSKVFRETEISHKSSEKSCDDSDSNDLKANSIKNTDSISNSELQSSPILIAASIKSDDETEKSLTRQAAKESTTESTRPEPKNQSLGSTTSIKSNEIENSAMQLELKETSEEPLLGSGVTESSKSEPANPLTGSISPIKSEEVKKPSTNLVAEVCTNKVINESVMTESHKLEHKALLTKSTTSIKPTETNSSSTQLEIKRSTTEPISEAGATESSKLEPKDLLPQPPTSCKTNEAEKPCTKVQVKGYVAGPRVEVTAAESSGFDLKNPSIKSFLSSESNKIEKPSAKEPPVQLPTSTESDEIDKPVIKIEVKRYTMESGTTECTKMELEDQSIEATSVKSNEIKSSSTQLEVETSTTESVSEVGAIKSSKLDLKDPLIQCSASCKTSAVEESSAKLEDKKSPIKPMVDPAIAQCFKTELEDQSVDSRTPTKSSEIGKPSTLPEVEVSTKKPIKDPLAIESSKLEDPLIQSSISLTSNKDDAAIKSEIKECVIAPISKLETAKSSELKLGTNEKESTKKLLEKPPVSGGETGPNPCEELKDDVLIKKEKSITIKAEEIVPVVSDSKVSDVIADSSESQTNHETASASLDKDSTNHSTQLSSDSNRTEPPVPDLKATVGKEEDAGLPIATNEADEAKTELESTKGINQAEEKDVSTNQLTFDYDASLQSQILQQTKTLLSEIATPPRRGRPGRPKKSLNTLDFVDSGKENEQLQPVPKRQSSRIAKLREKEDEERRLAESNRLQRLKEEHGRREKRRLEREERKKKIEEKQQRYQLKSITGAPTEYDDTEEESSSDEGKYKKKDKKRKKKKKRKDTPWDSSESSDQKSESEEDGLEDLQEEEDEELVFKSDHEFSPESDLDEEDAAAQPRKHARTARADIVPKKRGRPSLKSKPEEIEEEECEPEEDVEDEEDEVDHSCQKCGQSDHPEWILLCDRCDLGWHASCLKPPLMVIPEGNWYCPPCEHAALLECLQDRLEAYEFLLQEKEAEMERRREQELAAKKAQEEAEKEEQAMEEEQQEEDGTSSGVEDHMNEGAEEEESSSSDSDGSEEEEENDSEDESGNDNPNRRRQRRAAQQTNYSFKDYDDMIKSALQDEGDGEEETEKEKKKSSGKNIDNDDSEDKEPSRIRPAGIGNKRISTSDDDSDIIPRVVRKKKSRKLNDLNATSDEQDDSDESFKGASSSANDSDEDDEEVSASGDSFVVDDDSDSDVVHVRDKRKARAVSPVVRRSTRRNPRKKYSQKYDSETSEDESEFEVAPKRKRGNDSWEESGNSSSDASWGRSKKPKHAAKGRSRPVVIPIAKPKPKPAKKAPSRGRGRGGRNTKIESDDEPFRSNISVKKIKEKKILAKESKEEDEDSDQLQRRSTRGRQVSYKEMISSGDSQDESNPVKRMGTLFSGRGGAGRGRGRGGRTSAMDNTSAISKGSLDDESRYSGSNDILEFSNAAAAASAAAAGYTATGDDSHTSNDILPSIVGPTLESLPTVLPQDEVVDSLAKGQASSSISGLPPDLQVNRLIQQRTSDTLASSLPADLQVSRLINSQRISSPILPSAASGTPPPASISTPMEHPLYPGVIKPTGYSLSPTPPRYPGSIGKVNDLATGGSSVIRPGNPLSIQGLLSNSSSNSNSSNSAVGMPNPTPSLSHSPHSQIRPYSNTSHLIGHGSFLNHPPYSSPYSAIPPRTGYMSTPRPAYPPIYSSAHVPVPHGLPLHSAYPPTHGSPIRPTSSYQHAGFPQAFAAAAAAAANAEEERRIYRVAQVNRDPNENPEGVSAGLLLKGGVEDLSVPTGGPPDSEFGGLVSYFSSQQEDFEES